MEGWDLKAPSSTDFCSALGPVSPWNCFQSEEIVGRRLNVWRALHSICPSSQCFSTTRGSQVVLILTVKLRYSSHWNFQNPLLPSLGGPVRCAWFLPAEGIVLCKVAPPKFYRPEKVDLVNYFSFECWLICSHPARSPKTSWHKKDFIPCCCLFSVVKVAPTFITML